MRSIYYQPKEGFVGDVIPYYENGEFKLFYLHNFRGKAPEGEQDGWYLISTKDFLNIEEHGACRIQGGTGHVLKIGGIYHMFYCQFPEGRQIVCHAISEDFKEWKDIPNDRFAADDEIYALSDWRDPYVFWNEDAGEYWMLLAAKEKKPGARNGCIGLCTSKDLTKWEYREPVYAPHINVGAHECPDLFKIGDWWYLIFSAYTDKFATFYRMSRSLNGPWITPSVDTFDCRAFYAAKTATDGSRRFLFGWNPTKTENLFGWNPLRYAGHDHHTWDWGGSLIVHELVQNADGTLSVKVPDSVQQIFKKEEDFRQQASVGNWIKSGDKLASDSSYAFSSTLSNVQLPSCCMLSAKVSFTEQTQACGFMLRVQPDLAHAYYIQLEPGRNRIVYRSPLMQSEEGGKTLPYEVELERPIELLAGKMHEIKVFVEDSICEVYINDCVAMSTRMYDLSKGRWGLFVSQGNAVFEDISLKVL